MNKLSRDVLICFAAIPIAVYAFYMWNYPHFTPETSVAWAKVPPDVQSQFIAHADGGEVEEISDGVWRNKVYFQATAITADKEQVVIKVNEAGKLIGLRYGDDADAGCKTGEIQSSPTR